MIVILAIGIFSLFLLVGEDEAPSDWVGTQREWDAWLDKFKKRREE